MDSPYVLSGPCCEVILPNYYKILYRQDRYSVFFLVRLKEEPTSMLYIYTTTERFAGQGRDLATSLSQSPTSPVKLSELLTLIANVGSKVKLAGRLYAMTGDALQIFCWSLFVFFLIICISNNAYIYFFFSFDLSLTVLITSYSVVIADQANLQASIEI